jgi:hypothetical protein
VGYLVKPNVYVLGGKVEIDMYPTDLSGTFFVPSRSRLSIKEPDGDIITVSGADLTVASGYLYYLYRPPTIGWFEYESWVEDSTEREVAQTNGFEVIDRVY